MMYSALNAMTVVLPEPGPEQQGPLHVATTQVTTIVYKL